MATTLILPGLFGFPSRYYDWFNGQLTTVGRIPPHTLGVDFAPITEVSGVPYNWFNPFSAAKTRLDKALRDTRGEVIVLAHSQGALGVAQWLRDKGDDSPVEPERVLFVCTGCADDVRPVFRFNKRYRVVNVIRQWDEYADPANVRSSQWFRDAQRNADDLKPHTFGYQSLDLYARPARQNVKDGATHMFYDMPVVSTVVRASRQQIETAYRRDYLGS